jgi:hypothetical protein
MPGDSWNAPSRRRSPWPRQSNPPTAPTSCAHYWTPEPRATYVAKLSAEVRLLKDRADAFAVIGVAQHRPLSKMFVATRRLE